MPLFASDPPSESTLGAMKFNGMLEWLQTQLTASPPPTQKQKQKPAKVPEPQVEQRTEDLKPSPVEDAPDALPAEGVSDESAIIPQAEAAPPEPEMEIMDEAGQTPMETEMRHQEL